MKKYAQNRAKPELFKPKTTVAEVDMNKYVRPDRRKLYYNVDQYILNGENNEYYNFLYDKYTGSKTNQAVIDKIVRYTLGDGIYNKGESIKNIISRDCLKKLITDYKVTGNAAVFVEYNWDRSQIVKIKHAPIRQVGVFNNYDILEEPEYYWWCFDWRDRFKFPPQLIDKFGKFYEPDQERARRELLFLKRPDASTISPYFSEPDWEAVIEYAEWEQMFTHRMKEDIQNGFAPKFSVTMFGVEDTYDAKKAAYDNFKRNMTGPNGDQFAMVFADSQDQKPVFEVFPQTDRSDNNEFVTNEAEKSIIMGHGLYPILLGSEDASGFSDDAKLMNTALKLLYRDVINSYREEIIDALENILKFNDPEVDLKFKDFPELNTEALVEPIADTTITTDETPIA